jgi:anaerobic selenocysteine-containing dehydrogenase
VIAIDPVSQPLGGEVHAASRAPAGTDGALALALMHVLISEDLIDRDYIEKYTLGL